MHACTHTSSRYGCARPTDRERSHRIVEESGLTHGRRVAYLYAGGNDRYGFVSFRLATVLVALLFFAISPDSASTIVVRQVSNLSDERIVRATLIRGRQVRERRRRRYVRWPAGSSNNRVKHDAISSRVRCEYKDSWHLFERYRNAMFRDSCRFVAPKLRDGCCDSASSNTTASIACIASCRIGWNRKEDSRSVGRRSGGAERRGVALLAGSREPAAAMPDGRRRTDRQECRSRCSVARCICHMVNGFRVARHHR